MGVTDGGETAGDETAPEHDAGDAGSAPTDDTSDRLRAAVRGSIGFLSRLPVAHDGRAWQAFRRTPLAFPVAGYVVGVVVALPVALVLALGAPSPTVAATYLVSLYVVTGVHHADGVADLGDAAVVHGTSAERREVLKDTTVGVGAVLALGLVLAALALAGLGLASLPLLTAVGLLVAAEVGAKLGLAAVACLGEATHDGLGAEFTRHADPALLLGPAVVSVPALALTGVSLAALAAMLGAVATALLVVRWADARLGGVNGDVFGAANELGRVVALHAGVTVWWLF